MISAVTTNHTFRKLDLSLYPDLKEPFKAVNSRLGGPTKVITGHSKAAQNFLRCLMTPTGHYKSRPNYGSEFSNRVYSGSIIFLEDLPNLFATEGLRVLEQVFDPKNASFPDDEVIIRAELADFKASPGTVSLEIHLYYRNEDQPKQIRLPITLDKVS
jgi:hypothetical protein